MIGHNPKTSQNQADDLQDIRALLKELPRVSAPVDFNAGLKARIAAAKAEANEFADITSLIRELPRVTAPSDFDFRLRARIAQAKAEEQKVSAGWFAELFGRTFSWAQAGAAMAAVAIVVSVVAFGVLRGDNPVQPADTNIATVAPTPQQAKIPEVNVPPQPAVREPGKEAAQILAVNNPTPPRVKNRGGHTSGTITPVPTQESETPAIATRTVIIKHRSGEARIVNLSEYNLGLQTASLRTNAAPNKADTFAANIY